jgi:hypothetical protein
MERYLVSRKTQTFTIALLAMCLLDQAHGAVVKKKDDDKKEDEKKTKTGGKKPPKKWELPKVCWDVRINNEKNFCYGATPWKLSEKVYYNSNNRDEGKFDFAPINNFFRGRKDVQGSSTKMEE